MQLECLLHARHKQLQFYVQTKEVLEAMRDDYRAGEVEVLKADGGASQNNLLLQIQADHLQVCQMAKG